jgi:pyruvate, water dikinase
MTSHEPLTLDFSDIRMPDTPRVGGKNASLGELFNAFHSKRIGVVDGFATTAHGFRLFLQQLDLEKRLSALFDDLNVNDVEALAKAGLAARNLVLETPLPPVLCDAALDAYERLCQRQGTPVELAVRSSATAEDLPEASFAGAAESFLNVRGKTGLIEAIHLCFASLYTDRAISYRAKMGYGQLQVALSVGVMPMVRSDKGSSGVLFTLDPETGFRDVVVVNGSWGLGEFIVKGAVIPDEWTVFKPSLEKKLVSIISRRLGSKESRLIYPENGRGTCGESTPLQERRKFCLSDAEVMRLAEWACMIEQHYSALAGHPQPMDIEWARDGVTGNLFIIQARPETVHSRKRRAASATTFRFTSKPGTPLVRGQAVGDKIGSGNVRVVSTPDELPSVLPGEVLVAAKTDPDWEPVMRKVAAIITDQGGRTAHAAIVSREFGIPCVVGTVSATELLQTGQPVTVSCSEGAEGRVYAGLVPYTVDELEQSEIPATRTQIMLTVGDPAQSFTLAALPNAGVGLARTEFIINNHIGVHPMALVRYPNLKNESAIRAISEKLDGEDSKSYFVRRFSEGVARIAAAFYPKPVIVRMSDFKTNEYAKLIGGREFEPEEENPMIGFRGASRYYDPAYAEGFALECEALVRVRRAMGLDNVKVMIPFCRTVDEGKRVIDEMAKRGLKQGEDGLEIYVMCELPSNVFCAQEFLEVFDGFSIGSNDLTQLILGLDRESGTLARLFDERNTAVRRAIAHAIAEAHRAGKHIGICGQAPSDYPEFAEWLVHEGIDSISLNPDTAVRTSLLVANAESEIPEEIRHTNRIVTYSH